MSTIFVSHSSKDNQASDDLASWLKQLGYRSIFLDFDPADGIPAGRNWEKELYRQVSRCQAVILLCSQYSMASDWCFFEMSLARVHGKHLFPVKIAPCSLRPQLTELQVIDFTTNKEEGFERLKRGLESAGLDPVHAFPPDRPPYPGLMALQEEDAAIFFGRDDDLNKALGVLNRHRLFGGVRLLLLVGSSGCGKSSLLRAGLAPRLRKDRNSWLLVGPIRPADRPLDNLTQALAEAFAKLGDQGRGTELGSQLTEALHQDDSRALIDISRELLHTAGKREASVLLMIDQFEELLEGGPAGEAARLLKLLRTPLELLDSPVMVLGTLRLDFIAQLQEQSSLRGLRFESLQLGPLSEEGFTQVIERPAELVGLELEPRLVRQLVNDTEAQDALPLLAFTLRELWQLRSESGRITVDDYRNLGGLENSVARAAEAVLAAEGLSDEQVRGLLRDPFVSMVRISEEGRYARRVVRWADIPEPSHPLLKRFVEKRLLVSSSQAQMPDREVVTEVQVVAGDAAISGKKQEPTLEVAHEALFRAWARVKSWLDEDLENLRLRESIRRDAEEWKRHDEKPDLLTHRGGRLEDAERLRHQPRFALGDVEVRYLNACVSLREAERKSKERVRRFIMSLIIFAALALAIGLWWKTIGEEKAQRRLATLHWVNGVDERDQKKDYLKAGHHFMQASGLTKNEPQRENGYLAGALLTDQISLAGIYDSKKPILTAGFARGSSEISIWEDDGTSGLLQVWNVDMEKRKEERRLEILGKKIRESPKGEWVVVWERDGWITIRNSHTGQTARETAHDDSRIPTFSEDERYVLTWQNGAAELFDLPKARRIAQFQLTHAIQGAEISSTGDRVLTWWEGGSATLWNAQGGEQLADILYPSTICGAAFSKEDSLLLIWAKDGSAALWDLEKARELAVLPAGAENMEGECRGVVRARFFGNSGQVLTWNYGRPGALHLWDARNGKLIFAFGHRDEVRRAVFSSDESRILSWGDDGTARIWSRETGKELCSLGHQGKVRGAAFNGDESLVLTWSEDNTARLWDGRTCDPVGYSLMHGDHVRGASFSDDGQRIMTWGDDLATRVWNLAERPRAVSFSLSEKERIRYAFYRESNNQVLGVTTDGVLKIWGEAGRQPQSLPLDSTIRGARFSRDGNALLTWSNDYLQLWNSDDGKPLTPLMNHEKSDFGIQGAAFSPDKRRLISWGDDHTARIWEAQTGKLLEALRHDGKQVTVSGALISADGTLVMTWSDDKKVRIWSVPGAKVEGGLSHDSEVLGAAFFKDTSRVLSWDMAGILRIWEWRSGRVLKRFHHKGATAISGAELSADEQWILSWRDKTARLWNSKKSDEERVPPLTHSGKINGACFCNEEARILTWSEDGSARLWDSQNGQPISGSLKHEGPVMGGMVDPDGTWLTTWTNNTVHRRHVAPSRPYPDSSPVLQLEVSTGTQLKAEGEIEIFSSGKWLEKREDLRSKLPPSARSR